MSLAWALVRNVGTCRLAPAGGQWRQRGPAVAGGRESPKRLIREGRVLMRGTGADRPVVAMKACNGAGAKGKGRPGFLDGQPR